jgi:hypothetical protein
VPKKNKSFSPYFTESDADQVRAAVQEAGHLEGYASITDLIEAATLREVKRLQRKTSWTHFGGGSLPEKKVRFPFP